MLYAFSSYTGACQLFYNGIGKNKLTRSRSAGGERAGREVEILIIGLTHVYVLQSAHRLWSLAHSRPGCCRSSALKILEALRTRARNATSHLNWRLRSFVEESLNAKNLPQCLRVSLGSCPTSVHPRRSQPGQALLTATPFNSFPLTGWRLFPLHSPA